MWPPPSQPLPRTETARAAAAHLAQVSSHTDVVPVVVIELAVHGLHQSLEGTGAQVDHQPDGAALEREVDVVGRLPGVEHQAVALEGAEGEGDLVGAALDGVVRKVVAEEFVPFEGRHEFLFPCRGDTSGRGG